MKNTPIVLLLLGLQGCFLFTKPPKPPDPPPVENKVEFVDSPQVFPIKERIVDEASGIVSSSTITNGLWVHNDGIWDKNVHLFGTDGSYKGAYALPFPNRDWEDIALGPGPNPSRNFIYLADIGDNGKSTDLYQIYRVIEPTTLNDRVGEPAVINFTYSDGKSHDAECLMIDPSTADLYIITKENLLSERLFWLPYPQSTDKNDVAELLGSIPYGLITAGDISPDGKEVLLKNLFSVYYWKRKENEPIFELLKRSRDVSPAYQTEPQGEAICFGKDQKGFYTISERRDGGAPVDLRYHAKK